MGYLKMARKKKGKTHLSGYFERNTTYPANLADITVSIKGKTKSYSVQTDLDGFFEIYDLPAGDYVIDPQLPPGWRVDKGRTSGSDDPRQINSFQVSIKAHAHTIERISIIR
jgi:hypothetical protein